MSIKVLLVDDDAEFRSITAIALESEGCEVLEATDGYAALEALQLETPDVVVCDLVMPGLDGTEIFRRIRQNPGFANVQLLLLSGLIEPDGSGCPSQHHADYFMSKQAHFKQLFQQIKLLASCLIVLILLSGISFAQTASPATTASDDLKNQLQRAITLAERAQDEVKQIRLQNEQLLQRLEQNTTELQRLRQAVMSLNEKSVTTEKNQNLTPDLSASLEALTEKVDVHEAEIKEHAQTKVESDSKTRVKIFGTILANTFLNTRDSSLNDVPLSAPNAASPIRKNNVGTSLRQSRFGVLLNGPRLGKSLGEARVSAEAEFDFWGGTNSDVLGSFRILTAFARLDWERTSLIVGQREPMISPRNPTSLAAVWFAPLTGAGNLWQWRPQLQVEHRVKPNDHSELQIQGGLLMPFGETLQGNVIEGGLGYESRLGFHRALASDKKLELGFGGYVQKRPFLLGRSVNSYAVTGDWAIPLGAKFDLTGEAYFGNANNLGEAAGSRNERQYAFTGLLSDPATKLRGVRAVGGWSQITYHARHDLDFNFAYGQDDPRNSDVLFGSPTATTRFKNQATFGNFIWQLRHNFLVSLEYRKLWTDYSNGRQSAGHFNLAFGYTF